MLTDYFSYYKLKNKSTPFQEEKNSPKFIDSQIFSVIKVLWYCLIAKRIFLEFFTHAFRKKLALIILVQCRHSIITQVVCYSSWKEIDFIFVIH